MKKPRLGGEGRSSRADAEREAQEELNRLTRQPGPPPPGAGVKGTGYQSQRPAFAPAAPAAPSGRPTFTSLRSTAPSPPAGGRDGDHRSPGFGGGRVPPPESDVDDGYDDEDYDEEGDDEDGIYYGPRTAKEEEEAITGLALRDWAAGRGKGDRWEEVALPRLDNSSIEAQRDRALQEIVARQERMQREYREQRARLQPVEGYTVADPRAAHQMNVLRRGKPPGMMNMAAVQTGAFNRQHRERMESEAAQSAKPAKGKAKAKPATKAATKAKPAPAKAPARATKAAATKVSATKAKPVVARATATKAKPVAAARPAATKAAGKATTKAKAGPVRSTAATRAARTAAPASKRPGATRQPALPDGVRPDSPIARAAAALARREAEAAGKPPRPTPAKARSTRAPRPR